MIYMSVLLINKSVIPVNNSVFQMPTRSTNTTKLFFTTMYFFGRGIMIHRTMEYGIHLLKSPPPKESVKKLGRELVELIRTIGGLSACIISCYLLFSPDLDIKNQPLIAYMALLYGIHYGQSRVSLKC